MLCRSLTWDSTSVFFFFFEILRLCADVPQPERVRLLHHAMRREVHEDTRRRFDSERRFDVGKASDQSDAEFRVLDGEGRFARDDPASCYGIGRS